MTRTRTRTRASGGPPELAGELGEVLSSAVEEYGEHVMHRASRKPPFKHIPTGIFTLDMALFGGVPESLTTLIYGRESSGKSTLAIRCAAQAQRKYPAKTVVYIDIEGTYDPQWAAAHGVDNDALYLVQPENGEQALELANEVLRADNSSMIIVDSLAALIPFKETQKHMEDSLPGLQARLISEFCRKVQNAMLDERGRDHRPSLLLLNQWRMKIGGFNRDPRVLPGGQAQHYVASVKIEMLNREHMGRDSRDIETVDYNDHSFKIAKCKLGSGIRTGEFKMIRDASNSLGAGFIDDGRTVATWAKKMGVVTGGGNSWYIDGLDQKFGNLQAIADYFYGDLGFYHEFQRRLITMQREACGLVPEDWY